MSSVVSSLKILCRLDFPSETVRLWEGSGPYIDSDGNLWRCCVLAEGALDSIESAINAEAWTLELGLSGIDEQTANIAWEEAENDNVIGTTVQVLIQDCDDNDQPVGDPAVAFTGTIDNIRFDEASSEDQIIASVTVEISNRFVLRTQTNGAVLSDVDQRARSAILNPGGNADKFCERVPGLQEKTVRWPAWN